MLQVGQRRHVERTEKPEFLVSIKEYGEYYPVRFETEVGKLPARSVFKETPVSHIAENWEVPWAQGRGAGGGGTWDGGKEGKLSEGFLLYQNKS